MPLMALPAVIAAGVGAAGSVTGAIIGANAKQGIATAQQQQAMEDRAAAMSYAAPTAQELQGISDRIQQQQRYQAVQDAAVQRDTQILNSLDPALVEAGKQAQNLMSGQQAAILAPMKQQQDYERNQLRQKLAAQLGPGFETSSAGQAALQNFDMQANLQTQQAQMGAMNQVSQFLGYGIQSSNAINNSDRMMAETGSNMSAQTLRSMGSIQERQSAAVLGTSKESIGAAGSESAGPAAFGAGLAGVGNSAMNIAGTWGAKGAQGLSPVTPSAPSSAQDLSGSKAVDFMMPKAG